MQLQIESHRDDGDDSALNTIILTCTDGTKLTSTKGHWGGLGEYEEIDDPDNNRIVGVWMRGEHDCGCCDDTAANGVRFKDLNGKMYKPGDGYWGSWGYSGCPPGSYVVGLRTMVEPPQGDEDDTGLNRAEFWCGRHPTTSPASPSYGCKCGDYANTATNRYPWQVDLVKDLSLILSILLPFFPYNNRKPQEPYCSGTLISENEVVTAAHCGTPLWVLVQNGRVPALQQVDIYHEITLLFY